MQQHPGASIRVLFLGETDRITKYVTTSYLQQHPGASLRFLFLGETDRITKWCDHQLPGCCCIAGGHIFGDSVRLAKKKDSYWRTWMLLHSWWSHHLVILSVSPRKRNRSDAPGCCCKAGGHIILVILSVSPRNGTVFTVSVRFNWSAFARAMHSTSIIR